MGFVVLDSIVVGDFKYHNIPRNNFVGQTFYFIVYSVKYIISGSGLVGDYFRFNYQTIPSHTFTINATLSLTTFSLERRTPSFPKRT